MAAKKYISIHEFCSSYQVDNSFIYSLNEFDLIKITEIEEEPAIEEENLRELEKMVRLHRDLHINIEGIDAISHLLHRVDRLQEEIIQLKNKLKRYED